MVSLWDVSKVAVHSIAHTHWFHRLPFWRKDLIPLDNSGNLPNHNPIVSISHHLISSADSLGLIPPTIRKRGNQSRKCSHPISGQSRYKSGNKQCLQLRRKTTNPAQYPTFHSVHGSTWVTMSGGNILTNLSDQLDQACTADALSLGVISLPR